MKEILDYTEKWLTKMLIGGKPMNGHDFYSMWRQNSKELRASGVTLGNELDGLYYALCLIEEHYGLLDKYEIKDGKLDWRWEFVQDETMSTQPTFIGDKKRRTLAWNLWWQLKQLKKLIDTQIAKANENSP